jgi:condensin complex subunit 2
VKFGPSYLLTLTHCLQASCTLDASVKIYSNRVDDTYTTSHRMLESLSRNNNSNNVYEEEDFLEADDDGNIPRPKAKVGGKSSSTRLNIAQTIEKNPEAINAVKLEHDYAFDPMFHKLSKAFDEGGARGMLVYNMVSCSFASHL